MDSQVSEIEKSDWMLSTIDEFAEAHDRLMSSIDREGQNFFQSFMEDDIHALAFFGYVTLQAAYETAGQELIARSVLPN